MKTTFSQDRAALEAAGVVFPKEVRGYIEDAAQPGLLTQVNAGIPAFLTNYIDPKVIEVLLQPMKAVAITTEVGMGTWTTKTAQFPVIEYAGEVSSYGDYNNNGTAGANVNWVPRQQYIYQAICEWGDQEQELMGLGKINYADSVRKAKATAFNKFQNKSYFFGIANLQNYGLLNDPNLIAAITPMTKTGGGTAWSAASLSTEVYQDIASLFAQLQFQLQGLVDRDSEMILALSPQSDANGLTKTSQYNVSVADMIKKNFPNMRIVTAPEYATTGGQLVQLIVPSIMGQESLVSAYGDKLRAFPMFRALSSFQQKFAAGTWGCILKFPPAVAQMLGV
jgi:hypothetical protein